MAESYHPHAVESAWQDWWEQSGFYTCDAKETLEERKPTNESERFIMVIPPPNVTGSLHLGHALTAAVEDTLTRWHRMLGHVTLYIPGTDHAGIATQSVVEKMLLKEDNLNRHDLGRDKFVSKVWEWKNNYGNKITTQLRCLGSSVDWNRERFTMDDMLSNAVLEAFNVFYENGLLYRDVRMGNWSCALKSAISEIEVDYEELDGRTFLHVKSHPGNSKDAQGRYEFGTLTSFAYKVEGGGGKDGKGDEDEDEEEIVVATTRLETMLGDTAVAVHPQDERYKHLHGKFVIHPFSNRKIPIITDEELVDMEFGTGAVKITPAHDPNDYECGKRHDLEFITILNEDGSINSHGGELFEGLMRYDARVKMEDELKSMGLFRGKVPNKMRLAICSRSGDILEPRITPQWYINCNSMAKRAMDVVSSGELQIIPKEHEKTWFHWLNNIRDWCISRQLWWGHQIPAWFATTKEENENSSSKIDKNDMNQNHRWIVARTQEEALQKAKVLLKCNNTENIVLERDEDVLDTWFSSGLFPFSVFGWPEQTDDYKAFYPTSLLETGLDILFFWVARMVMMGLHLTNKLPFHTVYLHAMIRDKDGRKMSKSLGNVIDPLEVIRGCTLQSLLDKLDAGNLPLKEVTKAKQDQIHDFPNGIPQCGSDALRFGLLAYTVQGRDVNLDIKRVVGYRNFCNKLWNATRFALQFLNDFKPNSNLLQELMEEEKEEEKDEEGRRSSIMATRDKFMISRLMNTFEIVNDCFKNYKFGESQMASYSLWMDDLCDVYLELIKPIVYDLSHSNTKSRWAAQATLWIALESGLRLLHPMMPFVTEELWQRLPGRGTLGKDEKESIMLSYYPQCIHKYKNIQAEKSMIYIMNIIKACRSLRSSYQITNKVLTDFYITIAASSAAPSASSSSSSREKNEETTTTTTTTTSSEEEEFIKDQMKDIYTLGKAKSIQININESSIPQSVGIVVVDETTTVRMDLTGLINYQSEIDKLTKNLNKLQPQYQQLKRKMNTPGYEEKVKEDIKLMNLDKVDSLSKKIHEITLAIEKFEKLKALEEEEEEKEKKEKEKEGGK